MGYSERVGQAPYGCDLSFLAFAFSARVFGYAMVGESSLVFSGMVCFRGLPERGFEIPDF